jgi:hypothetical protein
MYQPKGGIYSGNLHIALLDADDNPLGFRDVGNTRALTCDAPKVTKKTRPSFRNENFGLDIEDKIMNQTQQVKLSPDDITRENLAIALFGEDSVIAAQTGEAVTGEDLVVYAGKKSRLAHRRVKASPAPVIKAETPADWQASHSYALGAFVKKLTTPNAYRYECTVAGESDDVEPTWPTTEGGTVVDGAATWTCRRLTYVEDEDYAVDYNYGLIEVLEGGKITDGQTLVCGYSTDDHPAGYLVKANKVQQIIIAMLLLGKNTISNEDVEVNVFKVSLNPSAIDWITSDFNKIDIVGDILACAAGTWDVKVIPPKA